MTHALALALQRQHERTSAAADECVRLTLRALNEAAYAAERAARQAGDPLRPELLRIARETDAMVEGR